MTRLSIKLVVALSLFIAQSITAQEIQGKAEYFWKRKLNDEAEKIQISTGEQVDPAFEKAMGEALKKASEKQYILTFNKTECLYEEKKELEKPTNPSEEFKISVSFQTSGNKYLNIREQKSIVEDNIFGKEFLIVEPLSKPNWILTNETKKIGEYTCMKAELVIPVTEKEKNDYEEFLKREAKKPSLFKMEKPEDKKITAWFTPEIPISFGPDNYWGLPGLILEVSDESSVLVCSKVSLSNKEKIKIKIPNTGDKVSQKKFDEIKKKKEDSYMNEDGVIIFKN